VFGLFHALLAATLAGGRSPAIGFGGVPGMLVTPSTYFPIPPGLDDGRFIA